MSDNLTKAAPVVQQRFVLPCAACGASPAPEPTSNCWWCGAALIVPDYSSFVVNYTLDGYLVRYK
jgi:hypothetical protein